MESNLLKIDEWVHNFWEKNDILRRTLRWRKGKKKFFFLDGPPYATGYVHIGTARNKTIKDYYLRYNRMKGFDVWAQPGYDTHGLPIESKVEKKLGIASKQDIEKMGVENFNKECARFATQFVDFMAKAFKSLGIWYDWDKPYYTYSNEYIDGAWYTLKVAYSKGLLYKGKYPVHICPHCQTASAFYEINYKNISDTAIVAKFKVKGKNEFLLIFTTTPWTLPANTGVMVNPKDTYVRAKFGDEVWICSEGTLKSIGDFIGKEAKMPERFSGQKLVGTEYEAPFAELPLQKDIRPRVVPSARFVDAKEGTGLVHCAPGHGQEDYQVGMEQGLSLLSPVDLSGRYTAEAGEFAGRFVKDCDEDIIEILRSRGLLIGTIDVKHDYPFCWRCDSALLFASVPQWFFKVSDFKDALLKLNENIKWEPEWGRKRFHDWLTNISDWPISRQRYWGIPIPIWVCEKCGELKVVGSIYDLPEKLKDVHKPFIDKVTFKCKCGSIMHRTPDILDVWFDSGVASWASIGYPKKKELFKSMWPPEFNTEGTDQFRGWWNSQLITSYVTFGKLPYKAIRVHGMTWDKTGQPMSKSRGNYVEPHEIYNSSGRDALRWYLPYDDPSLEFKFDWEGRGKQLLPFFNTLFNLINYIELNGKRKKPNRLDVEDKWILSKVNSLLSDVTTFNDNYQEYRAIQAIDNFVAEDFSKFYIKLVREKVESSSASTIYTLNYVIDKVVRMLAPIIPFSTEYIYQKLLRMEKDPLSIHMTDWQRPDKKLINHKLEEEFSSVQDVISSIFASRAQMQRGTRWPVKEATIVSQNKQVKSAVKKYAKLISSMTNMLSVKAADLVKGAKVIVKPNYSILGKKIGGKIKDVAKLLEKVKEVPKSVTVGGEKIGLTKEDLIIQEVVPEGLFSMQGPEFTVYLSKEETSAMLASGFAREIIRKVQDLRKKAELVKKDQIALTLSIPKGVDINKHLKEVQKKVGAKSICIGKVKGIHIEKFSVRDKNFEVGF